MKKKVCILFQGDSITDADRDQRNYHDMGKGYPKYAAAQIAKEFSNIDFEFINFGIGGNRTCQLFDRLYLDGIAFQPDIFSVLIGINDIWGRYKDYKTATTDEQLLLNYRSILARIKKETNAKILMLSPYVLDDETKKTVKDDLNRVMPGIRALAEEFADAYIPLDMLFEDAVMLQSEPKHYSDDGIHPNEAGAKFIAYHYAEAVKPFLQSIQTEQERSINDEK